MTPRHVIDLDAAVLAISSVPKGGWDVVTRRSTISRIDAAGRLVERHTIVVPPFEVTAAARTPDGRFAAALESTDQPELHTVVVTADHPIDLDAGGPAPGLHTAHRVSSLVWNRTGDRLAIADRHHRWVLDAGAAIRWRDLGASSSFEVAAWIDDRTVAWGGAGGFEVTGLSDGVLRAVDSVGVITCIACDPTCTMLLTGDARGEIRVTSIATGEALGLDGFAGRIDHVWWEPTAIAAVVDDSVMRWQWSGADIVGDPEWADLGLEPGDWVTAALPVEAGRALIGCRSGRLLMA